MQNKYEKLLDEFNSKDKILIDYVQSLWIDLLQDFDLNLLKRAFTHKSFSNDLHKKIESNERLEFLGDAILWVVIADNLYNEEKTMWEDIMSLYKIALVNEKILAEVARDIQAGKHIFLGLGEINSDWSEKDSVLSDFIEAFIAYLYLDLWEQQARDFIDKYIYSKYSKIKKSWKIKSTKSMLQEFMQKKYKIVPVYVDIDYKVDDKWNTIEYMSEVYLEDKLLATWRWSNKKNSQSNAAEIALKNIWIIK